jgi:MFS family permease
VLEDRDRVTAASGGRVGPTFFAGTAALYTADLVLSMMLTWSVLKLSGSPLLAALALVLQQAPTMAVGLIGPSALLRAHSPGRWLLVSGLAIGMLACVAIVDRPAHILVALVMGIGLLEGLADAIAVPTGQAWLMARTPDARRIRASRDYEVASRTPRVVAPLLGGVLLAAHRVGQALLLVGVLLALTGILWRPVRESDAGDPSPSGWRLSWATLIHDRWLRLALGLRGLSNLLWPAFSLGLPLVVMTRLHENAAMYGILLTVYALSTLVLAALGGHLTGTWLRRGYFGAWVAAGTGFVGLAFAPNAVTVFLATVLVGLGQPLMHMAIDSHIGRYVAPRSKPALYAFQRLVMAGMGVTGSLVAGSWFQTAPVATVLGVAGAILVVAALSGFFLADRMRSPAV